VELKQSDEALRTLEKALATGGMEARAVIQKDPRFIPLWNQSMSKTRNLIGFPSDMTQ
jgi:hypothetical protein